MKPLEGIKVLDLTRVLAGPTCTMILGDLGAEIIKVENPENGDETREWGPPFQQNMSAYFLCANRNKKSVTINLKNPASKEIITRLTKVSDVVALNFPKGHLEKLNLEYSFFYVLKPEIIWANITGFGLTGPRCYEPGYDIMLQGISGLMSITGEKDGEPMKVGVAIADVVTALYTAIAIISAIRRKEKTGLGAMIDNSLLECTVSSLVNVASSYLMNKKEPIRYGNEHANIVPYQVFKAKEEYFILAVGNDIQWQKLCKILNREDLSHKEDFMTNQNRVKNRSILIPLLQEIFLTHNSRYWIDACVREGIPAGPVNHLSETFADSQLIHRGLKQNTYHEAYGNLEILRSPIHFGDVDFSVTEPPPTLGEHNQEILERLHFSKQEIITMKEDGII
jgi:crotonobetainyl-CoA:carnitine CoA-transferase CaiB-like acyl-CoA transferase